MDHLCTKDSTQRVQWKVYLLQSMMEFLKYFGQCNFWSHKVTKFMTQYCIKTLHLYSSKRTCHINIWYCFIKDRLASGEVKLEYCPTETMLADAFTKPLQESAFIWFRVASWMILVTKVMTYKKGVCWRYLMTRYVNHMLNILTRQRR